MRLQISTCRLTSVVLIIFLIGLFFSVPVQAFQDDQPKQDFTRLSQPAVAAQLGLTDQQRSKIASLLTERINNLVSAKPEERQAIRTKNNSDLASLLTEKQRLQLELLAFDGKLRFNFRAEKWENVLDWFARESGLSLVMDVAPPGEFTYSDDKEYSPAQSIDLLNSILISKSFTLIRREKMLIVANVTDGIPYDLVPEITPEQVPQRGRFEWVRISFPLGTRPIETVLSEIKPVLSENGRATPLVASKKMLVTETAGKMAAISLLIAAVPEPVVTPPVVPPPKVFEIFPARGIEIEATVENLKTLFPNATFFGDTTAEQLQVYAIQADQDIIKSSIDQMVKNASTDLIVKLEVHYVDVEAVVQVAEQIQALYPEINIAANVASGRIAIVADSRIQTAVKSLVDKLGVQDNPDTSQSAVVVYPVADDQADGVSTVLTQMIPDAQVIVQSGRIAVLGTATEQVTAKALIQQLADTEDTSTQKRLKFYPASNVDVSTVDSLVAIAPEATITLLPDQELLSVISTEKNHQLIESTLQQISTQLTPPEKRTLTIYTVTEKQNSRFSELVADSASDFGSAKIVTSANPKEIAVWGIAREHATIAAVLEQIKLAEPTVERQLQRFPIEAADPTQFVSLLAEKHPELKFTLSATAKTVLVWVSPEETTQVKASVDELAAILPAEEVKSLEVYPIDGALTQAESLIAPVKGEASVTVDEPNQRLIVWATQKEHEQLKATLEKFSTGIANNRELNVYPLKGLTATSAQTLLTPVIGQATLTPDASGKSLLVWASPQDHQRIKSTLEAAATLATQDEVDLEVYDVDANRADQILSAIQLVFPEANASLDEAKKKLIVVADQVNQNQVKALVEKLQSKMPAQTIVIAYPLENADAASLLPVLQGLNNEASFSMDERSNQLLVTAELPEQIRLKSIIDQLDARQVAQDSLKSYPVDSVTPTVIKDVLEPLLENMQLTFDETSGKLFAQGRDSDHLKLQLLLEQIGDEGKNAKSLETHKFGNAEAASVETVLKQLVPAATFTVNAATKSVVVWATKDEHELVGEAMQQLSDAAVTSVARLKIFELSQPASSELLTMLQTLSPSAKLSLSADANQVIILGTPEEHLMFSAVIKELESLPNRQDSLQLKVYSADAIVITAAAPVVTDAVPKCRIVSQSNAKKLVVWATATEHEKIAKIIVDLSLQIAPPSGEQSIKIYRLDDIDDFTAIQLIGQDAVGATLLNSSDSNQLVVRADDENHANVERILRQLKLVFKVTVQKTIKSTPIRADLKEQATALIGTTLPSIEILINNNPDQLLVRATVGNHQLLQTLIRQLEEEIGQTKPRRLIAYPLIKLPESLATKVLNSRFTDLTFVDDGNTQQLLVWAFAEQHDLIPGVLQPLEDTIRQDADLKVVVYPIDKKRMPAQTVLNLLDASFTANAQIQLSIETNSLVIRTQPDNHIEIATAIAAIVEQLPVEEPPQLRIYELGSTDSANVSSLLMPLLDSGTINFSQDGNKLLATASTVDHQIIQSVLDQLQAAEHTPGQITKVYPLANALPSVLETVISNLVPEANVVSSDVSKTLIISASDDDHLKIDEVLQQIMAAQTFMKTEVFVLKLSDPASLVTAITSLVPDAKATADVKTNSLIVTAKPIDFPQIQAIVDKLDAASDSKFGNMVAKVYPFDPELVDAADMRDVLDPDLLADASLQVNEIGNGLIIRTTPEKHTQIQSIFDSVLIQLPESAKITTQVYSLKQIDPAIMSTVLGTIYSPSQATVDLKSQTMVATVAQKDHDKIQAIITQLEAAGTIEGQITKVYPLANALPSVLEAVISNLVPEANVVSSDVSKTLIISASDDDHLKIDEVLQQIMAAQTFMKTEVFVLKLSDPASLVTAITSLVPDAKATADVKTNSLIVTAKPIDFPQIQAIVDKLDAASDSKFGNMVAKVYPFDPELVDAADMRDVLDPDLLADASLQVNEIGNGLIIRTTPEKHTQIQSIFDSVLIQLPESAKITTQVYSLKQIDPAIMSTVLGTIYSPSQATVDLKSQTMVATVAQKDHDKIQAIITQLEAAGTIEGQITKVYPLANALPSVLEAVISNLVPEANVVSSDVSKTLIISASDDDHLKIDEVLQQIMAAQTFMKTEVFVLKLSDPASLVTAITSLVPDAKATADVKTNSLIVTAKPIDFPQIQAIVDKLDAASDSKFGNMVAKVYPFDPELVDAADMRDVLDPDLLADASLQVNEIGNGLIIRTTPEKHTQIQSIFDSVLKQLPESAKITTQVYSLKQIDPAIMSTVLSTIYSQSQATVDAKTRTIIATVANSDHEKIRAILEQMQASKNDLPLITRAFRITSASTAVVSDAISSLLPLAKVSSDTATRTIILTATKAELDSASELIAQIDGSGKDQITEVYRLISATPTNVMPAIQALMPGATITADAGSRSVFVTADADAQEIAAALIDKLNGVSAGQTTEVYTLLHADVNAVKPALESLVVSGQLTADTSSNSIVVIASPEEQSSVSELVKKLDEVPGKSPVLKLYRSKFDNHESLFEAMRNAFQGDSTIRMNYDWELKRITVVAPEVKHQLIADLIEQVDQARPTLVQRTARVYPVGNIDGRAAESTIRDLIREMEPRVEVRLEQSSNALIVVATEEQHPQIAKTLQEIDRDMKQLEVFQLYYVDPYTIELVIAELFSALPEDMMPSATSDVDTQQLFVRGSATQIEQVRDLLQKMGERFDQEISISKGAVRTIPFRGNSVDAVREIETIWPRIRKNRIQVIRPSRQKIRQELEPLKIPDSYQREESTPRVQPEIKGDKSPKDRKGLNVEETDRSAQDRGVESKTVFVSAPLAIQQDEQPFTKKAQTRQANDPQDPDQSEFADIIVIPGSNEVTIASSDLDALDQLEFFLRTIARRSRSNMATSNFAVFLLTNSSAPNVARLLSDLFNEIPEIERAGSVGDAVFVADERLNALVVYGSRKEREVIEEIVEVLDADDLPDSLTTAVPELIVVENADAGRILEILRDVYRTQLTNGGGRPSVAIPEGVSIEVASVLQQINAATAGPILTLGIDRNANSIVMRAPTELGREVRSFVSKLDQNTTEVPTRNIRIIRLKEATQTVSNNFFAALDPRIDPGDVVGVYSSVLADPAENLTLDQRGCRNWCQL